MPQDPRRPRLAVVVGNSITGDSRVQKTALAAARAGWDVTLVGVAPGRRTLRSTIGPIQVIRVSVGMEARENARRHKGLRRLITQFGASDRRSLARQRTKYRAWVRRMGARSAKVRASRKLPVWVRYPVRKAIGAMIRARRAIHRLRVRAFYWEERQPLKPVGDWRRDWPYLADLDLALGPVIEGLEPDLIHANDISMLCVVGLAVERMRGAGKTVRWIYDAHEYIAGIDWKRPEHASAFPAVEMEFIRRADAVLTVSPELAQLLKERYALEETPTVVRNAPVRHIAEPVNLKGNVRDLCGLDSDTPLMVYAGWISPERGLETAVRGLVDLPDLHLALVVGKSSPELTRLLNTAEQLGVDTRLHVLPYVATHEVPTYLSAANLGIICFQRTPNCEISLPTKLPEYLHARLPVVVSDVDALSRFVRRHDIGEVFTSGSTDSFVLAVSRALARSHVLRNNVTDELLDELSWERQVTALLDLYQRLHPCTLKQLGDEVPWSSPEVQTPPERTTSRRGTQWTRLAHTPIRLGIGPANYAGQAAAFADAICRMYSEVSADVVMRRLPESGDFPADKYVEAADLHQRSVQLALVDRIIGNYTHLIADAFLSVFGLLNGSSIGDDLPALKFVPIKVALLGHGSEIRHPGRHLARHEFSLFRDAPGGINEKLTLKAERNREIAEATQLPLFVTTPDLVDDLPWATWAPLVINVNDWMSTYPVLERRRPVVLHAPSRRWTKGTDRILPVLTDLADRGIIELRLAEGVGRAELMELVKSSDIVLDQFTTGAYGTFAVEAMAAGRPVIAYISKGLEDVIGTQPPCISATPKTLREAIESLLDDRDRGAAIGAESARYAREYHDGYRTALAFRDFLS